MAIFNVPLRTSPWASGIYHGRHECPVCGKAWWPWAGSYLPCHARCLMTESAQDEILACPDTVGVIADRLGVSVAVIRASLRLAAARKEARALS
jgi:hypothetical protein